MGLAARVRKWVVRRARVVGEVMVQQQVGKKG